MKYLTSTLTLAACISAQAGTDTWFTPLTESAPVVAPNALEELSEPWVAPEGISQKNILSLREIEDSILSPTSSIIRAPRLGNTASMFDMIAYDPTGNFLFIPHETSWGAGVSRLNLYTCENNVLFQGNGLGEQGNWTNDYAAFDPARFTPNGTVIAGEEWSGEGRIIEIMNPYAAPEDIVIRELDSIANVAHEGIGFSEKYNDTIYYVDEWNSGSIYKFVMTTPGVYTTGQTFVLSVDAFDGVAADYYNNSSNTTAPRVGDATWVPLTDVTGNLISGITDPFRNGPTNDPRTNSNTRGGRVAADDAGGTPYGRPEDIEIQILPNGNEVIYFTATSENRVYTIETREETTEARWKRVGRRWIWCPSETTRDKASVRVFVDANDTPRNLGHAATTGVLNSPDNLAQDALGNIYIIEDAPNGSSTGGDIWFIRDLDNDGVAESIDHFLSIRVDGSEATGMVFNPFFAEEFAICVQHPDSTNLANVPNGLGDAIWMFNVTHVPNQTFVNELRSAAE
ncbi:alkaline phosphatase PhoX [Verrucomicrobiaceae bacterium 227]